MASHSRSSKNRERPTYDLENLDYRERNEINDLELEDDEVENVTPRIFETRLLYYDVSIRKATSSK